MSGCKNIESRCEIGEDPEFVPKMISYESYCDGFSVIACTC